MQGFENEERSSHIAACADTRGLLTSARYSRVRFSGLALKPSYTCEVMWIVGEPRLSRLDWFAWSVLRASRSRGGEGEIDSAKDLLRLRDGDASVEGTAFALEVSVACHTGLSCVATSIVPTNWSSEEAALDQNDLCSTFGRCLVY